MKMMIILMSLFITIGSFAEDAKQLQRMTLSELSESKGIRAEKLRELMAPHAGAEQLDLSLEKIDSRFTDSYIQGVIDTYLENRTLRDLAEDTKYPIKKLGSKLGLEIENTNYDKSLSDLGISTQRVDRAIRDYEEGESGFLWNIVATGMLIVFIALILTGLIVALLEFFHRLSTQRAKRTSAAGGEIETVSDITANMSERTKRRLNITAKPKSANEPPDAYTLIAIATAIRLHEASLEEANRILATWTKASMSVWKANRSMPNSRFFNDRWGK